MSDIAKRLKLTKTLNSVVHSNMCPEPDQSRQPLCSMIMHIKGIVAAYRGRTIISVRMQTAVLSTYHLTTAAHWYHATSIRTSFRDQRLDFYNICCLAVHFNVDCMHAVTRWYAGFWCRVWFFGMKGGYLSCFVLVANVLHSYSHPGTVLQLCTAM